MNEVWLVWVREDGYETPEVIRSNVKKAKEWCARHHGHHDGTDVIIWEWDDPYYVGHTEAPRSYMLESFPFE